MKLSSNSRCNSARTHPSLSDTRAACARQIRPEGGGGKSYRNFTILPNRSGVRDFRYSARRADAATRRTVRPGVARVLTRGGGGGSPFDAGKHDASERYRHVRRGGRFCREKAETAHAWARELMSPGAPVVSCPRRRGRHLETPSTDLPSGKRVREIAFG